MERLQKIIAQSGITSRRKAEELITQGKVRVNGKIVKAIAKENTKQLNGNAISIKEDKVYYVLNKPRGVITSVSDDKGRKTVLDFIDTDKRIYPIGRLDYDTTGLVILTNDGDFANLLMHPSYHIPKTYIAKIEGLLNKEDIIRLKNGITIDNRQVNIIDFKIKDKNKEKQTSLIEITINEGRNHIVKKIFEKIKHPVIRLSRIKIAFLDIGNLKSGEYRELSIKEVKKFYSLK